MEDKFYSLEEISKWQLSENNNIKWYMAAFFRQVKIGVLTLTLEKKQ